MLFFTGVFLKHVIESVKNETAGILYLYSAHDLTLVNILRSLDFKSEFLKPGFGASFVIKFYKNETVKVFILFIFRYNSKVYFLDVLPQRRKKSCRTSSS